MNNVVKVVDRQMKEKDLVLDGAIRHDIDTRLAEYLTKTWFAALVTGSNCEANTDHSV